MSLYHVDYLCECNSELDDDGVRCVEDRPRCRVVVIH